jgi:hypothetical protein
VIAKSSSGFYGLVRATLLALVAIALAACGKSDDSRIIVYRIPKEQPPAQPAETGGAGNQALSVHWTAPSGWEEQQASGFRKGSYRVRGADGKTADISVISFPEAAGGVLANVNRWRSQLKLPPISNEAEIGAPIAVAGRDMFMVDLVSDEPFADGAKGRLLGGILPLPGETWFFKMAGPDELVAAQKEAFRQFLSSVQVSESAAQPIAESAPASAPMSANSGGNKTDAPPKTGIETSSGPPLQYKLPVGWEEKPLSTMRLASFKSVAPGGKETDISVVALPGTAGGDLANVNRWRGQLNLQPIDEDALGKSAEHLKANNHDYLLVDLESDAPLNGQPDKQRILAAISCDTDRCWFIKMTGETAAVEPQKVAFRDFLQSLKLP